MNFSQISVWLLQVYGMLMARSTYEGMKLANENKRPFVLTRAGFIGSQRYAATWTGDNLSNWEHLHMSISMVLQLVSNQEFTLIQREKKSDLCSLCCLPEANGTLEFTFVPSCVIYAFAIPANFPQIFSFIQWSCGELWGCLHCRICIGNQTH